ncbi:hypothetical protein TgHK011_009648 [Trichoderma gracile]|nr:hypothetical protein TgHK011_009648 [Trichoderma gracile]
MGEDEQRIENPESGSWAAEDDEGRATLPGSCATRNGRCAHPRGLLSARKTERRVDGAAFYRSPPTLRSSSSKAADDARLSLARRYSEVDACITAAGESKEPATTTPSKMPQTAFKSPQSCPGLAPSLSAQALQMAGHRPPPAREACRALPCR